MPAANTSRHGIWMFTKWYPNEEDVQLGVFIQKHARAISTFTDIAVLYVRPTANAEPTRLTVNTRGRLTEITVTYSSMQKHSTLTKFLAWWKAFRTGIDELQKIIPSPSLIHSYILLRPALAGWWYARRLNVPHVISEQWSGYATGKFMQSGWLKKFLSSRVVANASAVTYVSEYLRNAMHACGLRNTNEAVINNVIEPTVIRQDQSDGRVKMLVVADLVDEIKNVSGVIHAVSMLQPSSCELRIVGDGKDRAMLEKLAEEKGLLNNSIFFEGRKSNDEVYNYLNRCDYLVMNSRYETFSLICAEALSCGKPVVATRCGGPEEFLSEETGILIPVGDDQALTKAMKTMSETHSSYNKENLKQIAAGRFGFDSVATKFNSVYSIAGITNTG